MDLEKQPQKPAFPAEAAEAVGAAPAPAPAQDRLRASDADRDRIADILRDALAEGRLDAEEHSERIDAVYRAKTMGELQPLVQDLPAVRPASAPSGRPAPAGPQGPGENLIAVFSSSVRKGRWRVGARTNAFALFGSVEIDLTEALFSQRHTVINATSIFGSVEVRVPENISLRGNGNGLFGSFEVRTLESVETDAPVVTVHGYALFGSVEARPRRGRRVADLQERMRKYFLG
ncbi:DUF1707 SHOCT-like domain-containing protein [Streptomyces yaizuensis]|uniref:DUF1707 and DUF2154 domain-containing protein n=1 Tax=Streptomyces yaizuensis TaxID=2989713 RepID=A0ABQ5NVN8_9ACTN|nr:DUF1707 domain-containing protein [Streptomyces sp. YSPA8]GLF94425.1 DUF1707 and DUF2154 domain-containing protein [Streptomyces sp. YSPA8]